MMYISSLEKVNFVYSEKWPNFSHKMANGQLLILVLHSHK